MSGLAVGALLCAAVALILAVDGWWSHRQERRRHIEPVGPATLARLREDQSDDS